METSVPQIPVFEPVQVAEASPAVDQIENPIPYEGVVDEAFVPAIEVAAPQQEEAKPEESSYELSAAELDVLSSILAHTPQGKQTEENQQVSAAPTRIGVEVNVVRAQAEGPEAAPVQAETQETSQLGGIFSKLVHNIRKEHGEPEPKVEAPQVVAPQEPESTIGSVLSKLKDAVEKAHQQQDAPSTVPPVPVKPTIVPLPTRIGVQTSSKVTPAAEKEPVVEESKPVDDAKPECLSTVYESFSLLYSFQADAVAQDIKSLEDDYKSLESLTQDINSYCTPTINRDETFTGADDCNNELTTISDIIKKFKKGDTTSYLNVVDAIQNLWTVHKAFENDCVKSETPAVVVEEPVVPVQPVEEVKEEVAEPEVAPTVVDQCHESYATMTEQLVKMAEAAVVEDLSAILGDLNETKSTVYQINRFCDSHLRINVFPKGTMEAGNCQEDFANLRVAFSGSRISKLEDLAELTQTVWNLGFRLLHDC